MIDPVAAGLVIIYCIGLLAIGVWASKKIHNMTDYVVAWLIAGLLGIHHADDRIGLLGDVTPWCIRPWLQIRLAHDPGADRRTALDRVLYHLLRGQDVESGKEVRIPHRTGLPCAPV